MLVQLFHSMKPMQTATPPWQWCIGIFGAWSAKFLRRVCVFVQPFCVIFFLEVSPAPSHCGFNLLFTGIVWVGMKIPLDGNRANWYGHVAMVHGHDWRMLCSVCALDLRVAQPFPCNSHFLFLRFHRRRHTVVST